MAKIFEDVACTRCGCVCDDLSITVEGDRVVEAVRACHLAKDCLNKDSPPAAEINGLPASIGNAVHRAAEILSQARYPLVYGLSRSSTDGQRSAVRLADRIGASIDTTVSKLT